MDRQTDMKTPPKKRVLSGMQPSGRLHLGNLVGALQNWVHLQDEYDCFFFVADWHALTSGYADTSAFKDNIYNVLADWLAAGLDPERSTIFIQSMVKEHAELHVLLSMITPLSWLERVPTYKEKQEEIRGKDLGTYGFLGYPLLQSADILTYRPTYVPVGVDQLPHLEITREVARRFNHFYGNVLPEPEGLLTKFPKVPGVDGRKMSKSYDNCIYLSDPPEVVDKKIKTMITDPSRARRTDPGDPHICPVFDLHKIFSTDDERSSCAEGCRTARIGCIDCKKILIPHILNILEPIYTKRQDLIKNPEHLASIASEGSRKATTIASQTMEVVRKAMRI